MLPITEPLIYYYVSSKLIVLFGKLDDCDLLFKTLLLSSTVGNDHYNIVCILLEKATSYQLYFLTSFRLADQNSFCSTQILYSNGIFVTGLC